MKHLAYDEAKVVSALVQNCLRSGFALSVFDGEEWPLKLSMDKDAIADAIGTTDETTLTIRDPAKLVDGVPQRVGRVFLVHGNGRDVIADHTDNPVMEVLIAPAMALANERF